MVRSVKGVSQRELARRIGINSTLICRIERGYRLPDTDFLPRVAMALSMTPSELEHALDVAELAQRTCEVRR